MAFNFEEFGLTPETSLKNNVSAGFDFKTFGQASSPVAQPAQNEGIKPTFPLTGNETPLTAGLKATGNLPSSIARFGKGVFDLVANPIQSAKGLLSVGAGAIEQAIPGQQVNEPAFDAFVQAIKERYGSLDALQKTAVEDPFSFGADIASLIGGGAALAGRGAEAANLASKVARGVTQPVSRATTAASDLAKATTRFGVSQGTGLNPETITQILKNPQALKSVNPELRVQTAQAVADVLDTRLEELSGLGRGYEAIRSNVTPVEIPSNLLPKVLNKYGVKMDEAGKIVATPESRPLSTADRASLQEFIDNYGSQSSLTSNSFLNVREALSNLSRFEQGKTSLPQQIARDLRSEYDAIGKSQIPGLRELDTAYAPERQLLSQLKKDILDPRTGELKDAAISKIANLTGKGKEQLLERVKQIIPDIEERVNLIRTVEDIERSSGLKTGTYIRGAITGGGVLTGNIPLIISSIIAQPQIAVPLLRGAGYVGQKAKPILDALRSIANDVNNFRLPSQLLGENGNLKAGLSIEDVSKKTNPAMGQIVDDTSLLQEARKYKSAEEFVKAQPSYFRGEGGSDVAQGKALLAEGKHLAMDAEYPKRFGEVKEYALKPGAKIFDAGEMTFPEMTEKLGIPKKNYISPKELADILKGKGYAVLRYTGEYKSSGKPFTHIVDLTGDSTLSKSQLTDIWERANKKPKT